MKKAYCRIRYNEKTDSFELQTRLANEAYTDDFVISCKCQFAKLQESGEPELIHYSIIGELNKAIRLGYIYEC